MSSQPISVFQFNELIVSEVFRYYGRRTALRNVTLTLRSGELVGLVGPNGAGKSTLLGVMATLIQPSKGSVSYGDRSSRQAGASLRANIGFLSHDLQLYSDLTARENLEFFAGLYGLDRPEWHAENALDHAGLADRADDLVQGFSRGMRQRLALERVLLHKPRLILLDEPFTGLDEVAGTRLIARLRELKNEDCIVLLATHDLEIVDGLLDRTVMLHSGEIVELEKTMHGSLREQYQRTLQLISKV